MFKEAISSITSSVMGAAKNTLNQYRPSTILKPNGAFERIAQQGIANLSYRSPVMADLAQTMLQNMQLEMAKKDKRKEFVKSDASSGLREAVTKSMGDKTSQIKIDDEMMKILSKMDASIDKNGQEEAKKSDLFTKFGKFFEDFKKPQSSPAAPGQTPSSPSGESGSGVDSSPVLHKIETNTLRTYNALEEFVSRANLTGGVRGGNSSGSKDTFIDPITGLPSVSAAVGAVGGKFLAKIFDDDTIDKFANKTKKLFGFGDDDKKPTLTPERAKQEAVIDDILKPKVTRKETGASGTLASLKESLNFDNTTEANRENQRADDSKSDELTRVNKEMLGELKELNQHTKLKESKTALGDATKGLASRVINNSRPIIQGAKSIASKGVSAAKSVASKGIDGVMSAAQSAASYAPKIAESVSGLAKYAAPVLGVAAAGATGFMAAKNFLNPLIDKGVSAISGKEDSLGGWLHEKMNPESNSTTAAPKASAPMPTPAPRTSTTNISSMQAEKVKIEATQSSKSAPTVVVAGGGNGASGATAKGSNSPIISGSNIIRNPESTFERVQMQDFWPRTA